MTTDLMNLAVAASSCAILWVALGGRLSSLRQSRFDSALSRFRSSRRCLCATGVVLSSLAAGPVLATEASAPATAEGPIFRFHTDSFWLNLHHFLYVLGRAEAGMRDAERRAVAGAPGDQERGLETASPQEREIWRSAVSTYAQGPSQLDSVFDEELYGRVSDFAAAGESLERVGIDSSWAGALARAAPIYRRIWWPEHHEANRSWVEALEPLLTAHGSTVLDFITRAYGQSWPEDGYPVQLSGYSNWAGAYSTHGRLLVISSLDQALRGTSTGLEILFHESMHQFDGAVEDQLIEAATVEKVRFPRGTDHSPLFFTAGEAVRSAIPGHLPYAEQFGIWDRGFSRFLPMLKASWLPYLTGPDLGNDRVRAEALQDLMRHFRSSQ